MLISLDSGLSGLKAHQMYLDVIGNNLANVSTPGYKTSRLNFTDLFSNTLRAASSPSSNLGGRNPLQIGTGVKGSSIDLFMTQGPLLTTGKPFDIGINGNGFFILSNGTQNFYTRAGTFGLDASSYLVDQSTGMRVQSANLTDIQIDTVSTLAPNPTGAIDLGGNLPAEVTGPLAEVITSTEAFKDGTEAVITGTNTGPFTLSDGDTMTIRVNSGPSQTITFTASDFTAIGANIAACTAAEVATVVNNLGLTGFTASDSGGALVFTSDGTGTNATLDVDDGTGSPAMTLGLTLSMVAGTETAADENTLINDFTANLTDYSNGEIIEVTGMDANDLVVQANFVFGTDGTTLGDLRDFISANFSGATCTIDSDGNLVLTADSTGEANLSLFIDDGTGAAGNTLWPNFSVSTEGADEDTVITSATVYDSLGLNHTVQLTFTRLMPRSWAMDVSLPDNDGVVSNNPVQSIEFNEDGSFAAVLGGIDVSIQWNNMNSSQRINFAFGTPGDYDGMTMTGDTDSVQILSQDGYAAGELGSMSVDTDGSIVGLYTNGQFQTLGQIGLATFDNPNGLSKKGESVFIESPNSGTATYTAPTANGTGPLIGGTLEESNVDMSTEFVNLIEAQRGFQANARVVSTSDEVLAELVNLV